MPVYNEEKTISEIIKKVQNVNLGIDKELIIVNDASTDSSQKIIDKLKKQNKNISSFQHKRNFGKGAAIRTGLKHFTGDVVTIQDADLEYNPEDFKRMLSFILQGKTKAVYGSRLLGKSLGFSVPIHYYGNKFLSLITKLLYKSKITDMEACYKMFTKDVAKNLKLKSNKFDIEPEITAKIIKQGNKIIEIPINYDGRSFKEGKKITWKDGIIAIFTLLKYRFFN